MLTDVDLDDLWRGDRPLRNLTPQQWREITARLPSGAQPPPETLLQFLVAANLYWHDAAGPTPKARARLLTEAFAALHKAMDKLHAEGSQTSETILRRLSRESMALTLHADTVQKLTADDPAGATRFGRAHFHRHEFLAAALDLWLRCGGGVAFSRSSSRKPSGPLIRYLDTVCRIVMADKAPATETLAAFLSEWKRN